MQEQRNYTPEQQEPPSSAILETLQPYPQFVVWKYTVVDGKPKKPPFDPKTGQFASPTNPDTWSSLEQAQQALTTGRYNGLGFVFSEDDPFTGIDIDKCVVNGKLTQEARELVNELWSYTELSPSRAGLHILVEGSILDAGRRKDNIEIYFHQRYFTLTTNHLKGTPETIEDRQKELDQLYERLTPQPQPREHSVYERSRSDLDVLKKAENAKNGASFTALYNGNTAGFRSKSEADFTLILRLLYWTNDDIEQTKRLFRQSGLYAPEKTDRKTGEYTYLEVTISNALRKRKK